MTVDPGSRVPGAGLRGLSPADTKWTRLQDQIEWYDRKSGRAQSWFKRLKLATLVLAAGLPVAVAASAPGWLVAAMGALVAVLEGVQQLYKFQENWITYRSTCEALRHEQYLYLAGAGPYAQAGSRDALLAERIEGLVSQEHAKWAAVQEHTPTASTSR
jgi:Protein of unknown function (DUF4231)